MPGRAAGRARQQPGLNDRSGSATSRERRQAGQGDRPGRAAGRAGRIGQDSRPIKSFDNGHHSGTLLFSIIWPQMPLHEDYDDHI